MTKRGPTTRQKHRRTAGVGMRVRVFVTLFGVRVTLSIA